MKRSPTRRDELQIRESLKLIMEKSDYATSFAELGRLTGLSYSQIMTTLSRFPSAEEAMRRKLHNNKLLTGYRLAYVIDASIVNTSTQVLLQITNEGHHVIVLNVTLQELDKIAKGMEDKKAERAHILMDKALYNHDNFGLVDYRRPHTKPDDVVISYCKENRRNVILLTGDKNMALKAKGAGILVQYYTPAIVLPAVTKRTEDGKVVVDTRCRNGKAVRLVRRIGTIYENQRNPIELMSGDELYVIERQRGGRLHMEHYSILDDDGGNNLVYKGNIPAGRNARRQLPKQYRQIITDFEGRFDSRYRKRSS